MLLLLPNSMQTTGALAVAAAELVASIDGQPIDESPYNEAARQWIARAHPSSDPSLTNLARQAVSRVTGQNSERRSFGTIRARRRATSTQVVYEMTTS